MQTIARKAPVTGVVYAIAAAALFGASTPFAKLLVGAVEPLMLAGLLYLGSGFGLTALRLATSRRKDGRANVGRLRRADLPWLAGAIFVGGVVGPILLMFG